MSSPVAFCDIECSPNYFLIRFRSEEGKMKSFEIKDDDDSGFDRDVLYKLLQHITVVTFNGTDYDIPMAMIALTRKVSNEDLKKASDDIITNGRKNWETYRIHKLRYPDWIDHIDLIDVAPGVRTGLKLYGGRMHSQRLQDLPYPPDMRLNPREQKETKKYCGNDLVTTQDLYNNLVSEVRLREQMSEQYGIDLRSKSDAQVAEAVLKEEFRKATGVTPGKPDNVRKRFYYVPPDYIKFRTRHLQEALDACTQSLIRVDDKTGHCRMPRAIQNLDIKIGTTRYTIGLGGLHSQEKEVSYQADDKMVLIDKDVTSYYPYLILNMNMYPEGYGKHFAPVYRNILERRVAAKKSGDKATADSLKIALNGTFGKLANKYSTLYAPELMVRTTLTGQLSLLMLIEALEYIGIKVVSANTDGIVIHCSRDALTSLDTVCNAWEKRTGLNLEETRYRALYSRDVNSYIAVGEDGKLKTKGAFADGSLMRNPANEICKDAIGELLLHGTSIEETVRGCTDIRKFLTVRTVKGGAEHEGNYLGKVVRWYYGRGVSSCITYKSNGNMVPRTIGAVPAMDLPKEFPDDIDYEWYIIECYEMLMDIGCVPRVQIPKPPRKNSKEWKKLVEQGDLVPVKDKWEWSRERYKEALSVVIQQAKELRNMSQAVLPPEGAEGV